MRRNTILWADDDPDDLQMMREILAKNKRNFDITEVRNGKEAMVYLEKIEKDDYPCLIIQNSKLSSYSSLATNT